MLSKIERLPYFGSDHFPIFIELNLEKEKGQQLQEVPAVSREEKKEAKQKIEKINPPIKKGED